MDLLLDDDLLSPRSRSRSLPASRDVSSSPIGTTSFETQEIDELAQDER